MIHEGKDFKQCTEPHWKPVQVIQNLGDMIIFLAMNGEMGSGILDTLEFVDVTVRKFRQDTVTLVQCGHYEGVDKHFCGRERWEFAYPTDPAELV